MIKGGAAQSKGLIGKVIYEIKTNGITSLWDKINMFVNYHTYNKYRRLLPSNISGTQTRNGVKIKHEDARLLDNIIGFPYYEYYEIEFIKNYVNGGDKVIDIGGGVGVSAVWCAWKTGKSGEVHTYEPSETSVKMIESARILNDIEAEIHINNVAVGEKGRNISCGERENTEVLPVDQIPDCDVLVMDCEGAELNIIRDMKIRPRTIIVETHNSFGSSKEEVTATLTNMGYSIIDENVESDVLAQVVAIRE